MFGAQRIQLLDFGTQVAKAVIGSHRRDGTLAVDSVRADVLDRSTATLQEYLEALRPHLQDLAKKYFRKGEPVHVLPGDSVVRCGVHTLPGVQDESVPELLKTSRRHFVGSFGTRVPIFEKSFPIHVRREDDLVQATVVHAYCRRPDADLIRQALLEAGLKPGSILSPLLALAEVCASIQETVEVTAEPPRIVLDVGATSTSLIVLDGTTIRAYRKIYAGSCDWVRRMPVECPEIDDCLARRLGAALTVGGFRGMTQALEEAGLPVDLATSLRDRIERSWDDLLMAVKQTLPELLSPVDTDEEDETEEEVEAGTPLGPAALVGGGASLEGFARMASQKLGVACSEVDPITVSRMAGPGQLPVSAGALAVAVGALRVFSRAGAEESDVAEAWTAETQIAVDEEATSLRWLLRPVVVVLLVIVLASLGIGFLSSTLEARLKESTQSYEVEKAGLPAPAEVQKILMVYRDLRSREVAVDARFAYVSLLLKNRVSYGRLMNAFDPTAMKGAVALKSVSVQVQWPSTGQAARGSVRKAKQIAYVVKGEAKTLPDVTAYVQSLKKVPFVKEARIAKSGMTSGGRAGAAYAFEVSGEVERGEAQER